MKTERFIRAYDALVKAFFEGKLNYFDCEACAVGNMVYYSTGKRGVNWFGYTYAISFPANYPDGYDSSLGKRELADVEVSATGYTTKELHQIETAFGKGLEEADSDDGRIVDCQYNGLAAVVDVLLKLDNITPEDHYKNKFREHPQLV